MVASLHMSTWASRSSKRRRKPPSRHGSPFPLPSPTHAVIGGGRTHVSAAAVAATAAAVAEGEGAVLPPNPPPPPFVRFHQVAVALIESQLDGHTSRRPSRLQYPPPMSSSSPFVRKARVWHRVPPPTVAPTQLRLHCRHTKRATSRASSSPTLSSIRWATKIPFVPPSDNQTDAVCGSWHDGVL